MSRLPFEASIKRIVFRPLAGPMGLARLVTDRAINREQSDSIEAPWPDLIVSAGVKNEPLCRWIRAQSGGRTRLLFLGRTWARRRHFDLVVTTPQYRLPDEPNVLQNLMTQHGVTRERLREAAAQWCVRYQQLPEPRIGVLLGGDSGPFVFGPLAARNLADALNALAGPRGGSVMITSSARTSPQAISVLESQLRVPHDVHRWRKDQAHNPFLGILGLADELVVTADSIAMLSEAAATGRLVHMFGLRPAGTPDADSTPKARAYAMIMRFGPQRLSRDLSLFHQAFVAAGFGVWLGDARRTDALPGDALAEAAATTARVTALLQ
ncbi:MAG: nucleoside-diphosphate sugar epimerase [Gammaproteobacteria bacterium]|nr:nucleoside-diphosphate sugar epimerase [Gammaproteobacteria bacterium]